MLKIVGKVTAEMTTSDPLGNSSADRARSPADEPELVKMPYLTPKKLAASWLNFAPSPASCQFLVLREFLIERIMALISFESTTAPPYFIILFLIFIYNYFY